MFFILISIIHDIKVTEFKVVDGLDKLNMEEEVCLGWFVGEGVAQMICGRCTTNEDCLWGNLSALTDDGKWVALLEGKK